METGSRAYRIGFLTFLLSASFVSLLISYIVDSIAVSTTFQLIYNSPMTLQNVIKLTLVFFIVYLVIEFTLWMFAELGYILNTKWISWSLILQNLSWLAISLGDIGVKIIMYMNHILLAPFVIYLTTIILYEIVKRIREDFDPKESIILPDNLDPLTAVVSSFVALLLKGLLFCIL